MTYTNKKSKQKVYILCIYSKNCKNDKIWVSSYGDPMVILWWSYGQSPIWGILAKKVQIYLHMSKKYSNFAAENKNPYIGNKNPYRGNNKNPCIGNINSFFYLIKLINYEKVTCTGHGCICIPGM